MYWSANIKKEELERFAGRLRIAAKSADDERLVWFLNGGASVLENLMMMEYGKDEESLVNYATWAFQALTMEDEDADD